MTIDYTAIAIVGYAIPTEKFHKEEKTNQCEHDIPAGAKYCPACGKKKKTYIQKYTIEEWDDLIDKLDENYNTITYSMEFMEEDRPYIYIGIGLTCNNNEFKGCPVPDTIEVKRKIQEFLQSFIDRELITLEDKYFGIWLSMPGR